MNENHEQPLNNFASDKAGVQMSLTTESGKEWKEPSSLQIKEAIEQLNGNSGSFVILNRGEYNFLQCLGGKSEGYHLEYQEGSLKDNYLCLNDLTENEVIEVFQAYRNGEETWKTKYEWEKQSLTRSFWR